ncbi:lysylphosphatidylglycerol synthase transmembrane domain-containing protein [Methanoculleus sp. 7T]|mgnify:CR=1 FL=1|uniref:lysylphosphatidylglycerol synthase transmembrane domain-containing protein n=1 Tax=Methanoculleus sp. 7T TaxID=2937282 RepID=UPI0020BE4291|nr:lysylphosphatidylglycerol synthase transmembrane domain-containing protein [Methanoculleus sp. 7T]MCK8518366.1 flippase-like domain-containing protein [Methanoculleus sp. 7T]
MVLKSISRIIHEHSFKIKLAITLIFIGILFSNFLQASSFELIERFSAQTISFLITLSIITLILRAWRWKCVLEMLGYEIPFLNSTHLYAAGIYYGSISPAKVGEFVRCYYLANYGIPTKEGFGSVIYERFYDIALPITVIGLYYLFVDDVTNYGFLILAYIGTLLLWIGLMVTFCGFKPKIPYLRDLKDINISNTRLIATSGFVTLLIWICFALIAYLILYAFGVDVEFLYILFSVCVAIVVGLLPITVGGWGVREGAYIIMLSPFAEPPVIIIFSLVFVFMTTYFLAFIGLISEWIVKHDKPPLAGDKDLL